MATQIGSTTPPVTVLLFVATSIAGCTYNETIRYCWAFIIAEVTVLLMVVFWPDLAAWIPHYFLGWTAAQAWARRGPQYRREYSNAVGDAAMIDRQRKRGRNR